MSLAQRSSFFHYLGSTVMALSFSFSAQALEVGTDAPCVVLEQRQVDGSFIEGCIRDRIEPTTQSYTVIDFSSIYCSYCEESLPALAELTTDIAETATVRKVLIDRNRAEILKYLDQKSALTVYPVALDTDRDAKRAYNVTATPTLFILNANNEVVYKHIGLLDRSAVREIKKVVR